MGARARVKANSSETKRNNTILHKWKTNFSQSKIPLIDHILALQRTIGNQAVQMLFQSGAIPVKLKIGQSGDIHEQEADHVADQVMSVPDPKLQRQPEEEKKEKMAQAKGDDGPSTASSSVESGINFVRGEVSTLPKSTHANEHLDAGEGILVGLTAAIALNCQPCMRYYLSQAKKAGISEGKVSKVVAKIMAVSANQKRLQTEEELNRHEV